MNTEGELFRALMPFEVMSSNWSFEKLVPDFPTKSFGNFVDSKPEVFPA